MLFGNNPLIYLTKKTWEYSKGNRPRVVAYIGMSFIANASYLFEPLVVASILNFIQTYGITRENVSQLLVKMLWLAGLVVIFWLFHGPARVIEMKNGFLNRANYKRYLLEGTMALPSSWHTDHHSGDTIDKIGKGTTALFEYSSSTFEIISSLVRLVGSLVILGFFSATSLLLATALSVITFLILALFDRALVRNYYKLNKAENAISEKIYDAISNITTVIILRIEKLVLASIMKKIMEPFRLFIRNNILNETKWFFASFLGVLMVVVVLGVYVLQQFQAGMPILVGSMYALYGYMKNIQDVFYNFANIYGNKVQQRSAVANAEEISREFRAVEKTTPIVLGQQWCELAIKALDFSYHNDDGADLHLDDVSMTMHRGERIALIGESGSGKTTLLKIIRELYKPQRIEVWLDGKLLRHGFAEISESIALIPQDPEIFTTTILENITVGVPYSIEHVKKFTDMARFTEVAERLPKKFDSSIVEKGVNLSGGEKQRLALARGLLACEDKAIVLLDEPTSSVDSGNELAIYENIFREFKDKTIISSVHRLHLLQQFDTIYLFENGRIIASGSFAELLQLSPEFQAMWEKYSQAIENQ